MSTGEDPPLRSAPTGNKWDLFSAYGAPGARGSVEGLGQHVVGHVQLWGVPGFWQARLQFAKRAKQPLAGGV